MPNNIVEEVHDFIPGTLIIPEAFKSIEKINNGLTPSFICNMYTRCKICNKTYFSKWHPVSLSDSLKVAKR